MAISGVTTGVFSYVAVRSVDPVASLLKMGTQQIKSALDRGYSLSDIASSRNISRSSLFDAVKQSFGDIGKPVVIGDYKSGVAPKDQANIDLLAYSIMDRRSGPLYRSKGSSRQEYDVEKSSSVTHCERSMSRKADGVYWC